MKVSLFHYCSSSPFLTPLPHLSPSLILPIVGFFSFHLVPCLLILKDMRAPDKKVEIEKVLVPISQDRFSDLTSIGKLISDYSDEAPTAAAGVFSIFFFFLFIFYFS
jgi:hypothetical protein